MSFTPPQGTALYSHELLEMSELSLLLGHTGGYLQNLTSEPQRLRLYHDWWEHDGLHFHRADITSSDLFQIISSPRAIFENTPPDEEVHVGIAPVDLQWYLRFRAEWGPDGERLVGRFSLILPTRLVTDFEKVIPKFLRDQLTQKPSREFYDQLSIAAAGHTSEPAEAGSPMIADLGTKWNGMNTSIYKLTANAAILKEIICYCLPGSEPEERTMISSVTLCFTEEEQLSLSVNPNTDEIVWGLPTNHDTQPIEATKLFPSIAQAYGLRILWSWEMTNHQGYRDALQLEIADPNLGTVSIIQFKVVASSIEFYAVNQLFPSDE